MALKKVCPHRGCTALVTSGYCDKHKKNNREARKQYDANRPAWHSWYNTERWRKARIRFLRHNPLCVECLKTNRINPATVVDHTEDHKGDYVLFWDESNWQSLCIKHHNSKTARENNQTRARQGVGGPKIFGALHP